MSSLMYMPWCTIDKVYNVDRLKIVPFERGKDLNGLEDNTIKSRVYKILKTHKGISSKPIDKAALLYYSDRSLVDDLTEEEVNDAYEGISLACLSGLANREYFEPHGRYCNSDCFALYVQKFDKADYTTLEIIKRDGRILNMIPTNMLAISIPVHCHLVQEVTLDELFLKALAGFRSSFKREWGRWQNAIICFNQANTDSWNIRYQVEWVLMCSAFEHLLKANPNARDVARKLSEALVPSKPLLVSKAERNSKFQRESVNELRYEWMREFYRIRGDFAHGKLSPQQPTVWSLREHLILASIAFPLVVKCLLRKACFYELTNEDQAQIDTFEQFAGKNDFLNPLTDRWGHQEYNWKRLCIFAKSKLETLKIIEEMKLEKQDSPE